MGWFTFYKEIPRLSLRGKLEFAMVVLCAVAIVVGSVHYRLKIWRPKQIVEKILPPHIESFKERSGMLGTHQQCSVSVQAHTNDGTRAIFPFPIRECRDLMVIDLKFKEKFPLALKKELLSVEGVSEAQVLPNRIVVHRPCVADAPGLWTWEDVWQNIRPVLSKHYEAAQ